MRFSPRFFLGGSLSSFPGIGATPGVISQRRICRLGHPSVSTSPSSDIFLKILDPSVNVIGLNNFPKDVI